MKAALSFLKRPWVSLSLAGLALIATFQNCSRYKITDNASIQAAKVQSATTESGGTNTSAGATGESNAASSTSSETPVVVPTKDPNNIVCDSSAQTTNTTGGLLAELYYKSKDSSGNFSSVKNFLDPLVATKSSKQIYFSQVNTPPQIFDKGFYTQNGSLVTDDLNQKLDEWFSLVYYSQLKITQSSQEGIYEFTSLSDDGMIFEAQIAGQWVTIVNNDGQHSPKMKCSTSTLTLKKDIPVPIRISYYQGPRMHIANMLHWRKISTSTAATSLASREESCDKVGTDYFFDYNNSTPLKPYLSFLDRGWTVIPASSFFLPVNASNPCVTME